MSRLVGNDDIIRIIVPKSVTIHDAEERLNYMRDVLDITELYGEPETEILGRINLSRRQSEELISISLEDGGNLYRGNNILDVQSSTHWDEDGNEYYLEPTEFQSVADALLVFEVEETG
ncbi:hypothetical protein MBO12_01170 [Candidatus Saccharibacteria bacterium]|nr:hypothetical protein [Candidatus Saccharibacteria bacterium]